MRKRDSGFIVTFPTTSAAMAFEKYCKEKEVPGRLIPVPGVISAGCGLCWLTPVSEQETLRELIKKESFSVQGEYLYNA